jgi:nucleolar protein 58
LKGDALKYNGITGRSNWLRTCDAAVSTYHLRIAKKKLLGSLVKEAYEAEAVEVCEKGKLRGESEQIPQEHAILDNRYSSGLSPRPPTVPITPSLSNPSTCLVGEVVRRSPRLNPKFYQNSGGYKHAWLDGTPSKRRKIAAPLAKGPSSSVQGEAS